MVLGYLAGTGSVFNRYPTWPSSDPSSNTADPLNVQPYNQGLIIGDEWVTLFEATRKHPSNIVIVHGSDGSQWRVAFGGQGFFRWHAGILFAGISINPRLVYGCTIRIWHQKVILIIIWWCSTTTIGLPIPVWGLLRQPNRRKHLHQSPSSYQLVTPGDGSIQNSARHSLHGMIIADCDHLSRRMH